MCRSTCLNCGNSVAEIVARQAVATPEAIAVEHGADRLTYRELARRASAVAGQLQQCGLNHGDRVGVYYTRSLDALVAMAGILWAGAVYVPLAPGWPKRRLQDMADDAELTAAIVPAGTICPIRGLRTVIYQSPPGEATTTRPPVSVDGATPAYVMFTSGSTGRAKPVVIPHRGITRLVLDTHTYTFTSTDRVLLGSTLEFDASTLEIWGTLLNGARGVIADTETVLSPPALHKLIHTAGITFMFLPTAVFHTIAHTHPHIFDGIGHVLVGGESVNPNLVRAVLRSSPPQRLINVYGPTENTSLSTAYLIEDVPAAATTIPIGRPINGTTCHVIRDNGDPARPGDDGELWVGGDGLALGYHGNPTLTAEKFVVRTVNGKPARLYRTGDRVRLLPDGVIDFIGRRDRQVKLRGFRIELDEIDHALCAHPAISQATATVEETRPGHPQLTAYVRPRDPSCTTIDERRLLAHLAEHLPPYMVPAQITILADMPLTSAGKIDTARLVEHHSGHTTPTDLPQHVEAVARHWRAVLNIENIAAADDFFVLGGDSLLAVQLMLRIQGEFSVSITDITRLLHGLLSRSSLQDFTALLTTLDRRTPSGGEPIDFTTEAHLDLTVSLPRSPGPTPANPDHVILTGATGFTGAYLLDRLLHETSAQVHCLVRARDTPHALQRITANLHRYGLDTTPLHTRVNAVRSDIATRHFSLTEPAFIELAETADLIVHAAAQVNFLYPYRYLKPANVTSTRTLIELATSRRIPIHYLSTIAVLAGFGSAGIRQVTEDSPLDHVGRLTMGYPETKWVSEQLLEQAATAGIPVSIYRPYEITGDLTTGAWNTATALPALFKMIAETGLAPEIDLPLDFVPVDRLAAAITHIALNPGDQMATRYHLTNPSPALLPAMTARLRTAGYQIRDTPYSEWVQEYSSFATRNPEHPFSTFLPIFLDLGNATDLTIKELYFQQTFPTFNRTNIDNALRGSGVTIPPVDDELLDLYIRYFNTSGHITLPQTLATRQSI